MDSLVIALIAAVMRLGFKARLCAAGRRTPSSTLLLPVTEEQDLHWQNESEQRGA